jgi:TonB family protein
MAATFLIVMSAFGVDAGPRKDDKQDEPQISAIYRPWPRYPLDARRKRMEGAGLFRLNIEPKSGGVRNVEILKSTGHKLLDDIGVQTFHKWRFPIGQVTSVKIPLEFKLTQITSENAKEYQIFTPPPMYPHALRRHHLRPTGIPQRQKRAGSGVFHLYIDYETGHVIEVETGESTGSKFLDDAAISGFRRWRFKPHPPFDVVRVPVTFLEPR